MSRRRNKLWSILKVLGITLIVIGGGLYALAYPSLGGDISGDRLQRVQASPHYRDGIFHNIVPQRPADTGTMVDYLYDQFFGDAILAPPFELPIIPMTFESADGRPAPGLRANWLGHASVYLEVDGVRLMTDPVFSERVSPLSFLGPARMHPTPVALDALPHIDAVMISHDHYDHLDKATIQYLATKGTRFFVPLGVGAHLQKWQVPSDQIVELDWGESQDILGLTINSTPTRHYSGRGLTDANETFWSSWSIIGPEHRVFYSGDTGFSDHFQAIGQEYGPFDLSIIKIGAYGPGGSWLDIHMPPEDSIHAHIALRAKRMLPVHWATFNLAAHDWDEPIKRALKAAAAENVDMVTPRLGETVDADEVFVSRRWWEGRL